MQEEIIMRDDLFEDKVSVRDGPTRRVYSILFRPHNYRRMVLTRAKTDVVMRRIKKKMPLATITPQNKLVSFKQFKPDVTIQFGRRKVIGIYNRPERVVYHIKAYSIQDLQQRVNYWREQIRGRIDGAIKEFLEQLCLPHLSVSIWQRYEDWLKGEEYIDSLPDDLIVHDTFFKKVYEQGVEFIGPKGHGLMPGVSVKHYIKNRAIEDVAPEIASSIYDVAGMIEPLRLLKSQVRCVDDVVCNADLVRMLSESERVDFENWLPKVMA